MTDRTRPLTIPAARIVRTGADWSTRRPVQSPVRREQLHGELQPMEEVRSEPWGKSLLCAVLVAVVLVAMVAAWGAFA